MRPPAFVLALVFQQTARLVLPRAPPAYHASQGTRPWVASARHVVQDTRWLEVSVPYLALVRTVLCAPPAHPPVIPARLATSCPLARLATLAVATQPRVDFAGRPVHRSPVAWSALLLQHALPVRQATSGPIAAAVIQDTVIQWLIQLLAN